MKPSEGLISFSSLSAASAPASSAATLTAGLLSNCQPFSQLTVDVSPSSSSQSGVVGADENAGNSRTSCDNKAGNSRSSSDNGGNSRSSSDNGRNSRSPPVYVGEKRKFELEPEEISQSATTATADTPPATLEPPEPKIIKTEGNYGDKFEERFEGNVKRRFVGNFIGKFVGSIEGFEGEFVGQVNGILDGRLDGNFDGELGGRLDGKMVGESEGIVVVSCKD